MLTPKTPKRILALALCALMIICAAPALAVDEVLPGQNDGPNVQRPVAGAVPTATPTNAPNIAGDTAQPSPSAEPSPVPSEEPEQAAEPTPIPTQARPIARAPRAFTPPLDPVGGTFNAQEGVAFAQDIAATTDAEPVTWSWSATSGSLPGGLSIARNDNTHNTIGTISGTPAESGTFAVTVKATDSGGAELTADYTIEIAAAPPPPADPTITTTAITDGKVGEAYNFTLAATGTAPITWTFTGDFPLGLSFNQNTGLIYGTPARAETKTITFKAENSVGNATKELTLKILSPSVSTTYLPEAELGDYYREQLTTDIANAKWSLTSGRLPYGLYLTEDGLIVGTPRRAGYYSFTVKAANDAESATQELYIYIQLGSRYYNPYNDPYYYPRYVPTPTATPAPAAPGSLPVPTVADPLPAQGETTRATNVRQEASTKSKLLGTLPTGSDITVTGFDGIHAKIEWQGGSAYVAANFIDVEFDAALDAEVTKNGWTYSRGSEQRKYRLTALKKGETLEISGREGKWYWMENDDGTRVYIPATIAQPID